MLNRTIRIFTLIFAFSLSQFAFADHHWQCREGLDKLVQELNLDDSQKAKIKPIVDQFKATMKDNGQQLDDLAKQIHQQVKSADFDESTVDSLIDKKTALLGNIMKAKVAATHQILTVLNDKQKAMLQSKMEKIEEKIAEKYQSCHD